ncbi:PIH1 domain-containing protein, putative [Plasmodium yoelii]|uniref:PIH1 domain-containing protein n=3 Tax=Plasmodium yoelii TaxID=5861 RepID=A0AAE9X3H7_PLAYO|nr:PIH1 domain-containing protein, putative [Plasmodium yoelii]WBY61148.1 PIH1 domain-containing protein [Plasmodium yoelii yoelii]CDU20865.1 PIH1 domain-containing protein, putative [Plasmodium yoelii]VTZ81830.1 PIH1 domain-containing protein, putative [Plasmodium yoelii]|eukprot:XP_022813015.1 PIH1 domain-containing protein, putative [Plasmodium yoelii]
MEKIYQYYFQQPNKNFEFNSENINNLVKNKKTIKISPQKGYVIKTYDKNGEKVYFNICSSNLISEFHFKKIPDLNNEEGLRIPLSIGEEKNKEDKKGNKYKTYDIVLNTKIVTQSKTDSHLKKIIAELVQAAIKNKYKTETCSNLFFFPDHKYKGNYPEDQFIKDDQQHKFEIVEEGEKSEKNMNSNNKENEDKAINIEKMLTIKEPQWDMWFVNKNVLEEKYKKMNKFYIPYIRMFPLDNAIYGFDFKPPFLNNNEKKKNYNTNFRSFLNDYNVDLDDDFLLYEQIDNTICIIQIHLPFFIFAQRNMNNLINIFPISQFLNIYISDECLKILFKKSPLFPTGYNPPYKSFTIRFPFYYKSSKVISQYLEKYALLNVIIPVTKNSASSIIFKEIVKSKNDDVFSDEESSCDSIF